MSEIYKAEEESEAVDQLPIEVDLQYHLLKMMIESETFFLNCKTSIREEFFENNIIGWFFSFICKYYDDFKKLPELVTVRNEISKFDVKDRSKYERAFEKIEFSRYSDEEYLTQQVTGWLRTRKFIQFYNSAANLFNTDRKEWAYEFSKNAIDELLALDLKLDKVVDFQGIEGFINKVSTDNRNRVPTGIDDIDLALGGGLAPQTLTTVLGVTNSGKSIMLMNMAYYAMLHGKKVLFIYHEGQDQQMILRFLARQTGIPYMRFFNGMSSFTKEDVEKIERAKGVFRERLVLKPWQQYGANLDEVIAYARKKKKEFDYDLIVDDYGQVLTVSTKYKEMRHNMAEVYRGFAQFAAEMNIAILTAAQGNRASHIDLEKGKRLMSMTDIAECYEIVRCSECVLTMTRTKEDQNNNKVKILLEKQRDGQTQIGVECVTDLQRLRMYDHRLGFSSLRLTEKNEIIEDEGAQEEVNSHIVR